MFILTKNNASHHQKKENICIFLQCLQILHQGYSLVIHGKFIVCNVQLKTTEKSCALLLHTDHGIITK